MLYHIHELQHVALAPVRLFAEAIQTMYTHPWMPVSYTSIGRAMAAGAELLERTTRRYPKPPFNLPTTVIDGVEVTVREMVVYQKPFCELLHFQRDTDRRDPRVLVVAPMSGHYATLLRGTVETLLPEHDVYITDWIDARDVSQDAGPFALDDYIDYIRELLHFLGADTHVLAVCQPSVPVLAAVSMMAEDQDPRQPSSMVLMGGPIDTRISPTKVNKLATDKPLSWFETHVINTVPYVHTGRGRRVYPGFLQLQGFMSLNPERHVGEHINLFQNMVRGDGDSAEKHRDFYDEYLAVMDLPAEYYLDTIKSVFIEHQLPEGKMYSRGRHIQPSKIQHTALMTIEGEKDDITGIGQTEAAHKLCSSLPDDMRIHHVAPKVGHYGVFNGRRWREEIYPHVREFIRTHDKLTVLADKALELDEPVRVGKSV
ncbi:polyhydroxyalkanoate depolymerase [Magnetospirillum sulfuroxidans]|uniref:Polyhydroxyalkanoate depolymerase n=1 Tax=Magnetospirillum sulfuroxidans TaxID=611300 RepID=A0ABS5IEJ8_9PROT|nr:polyhydroxyalkanoate depolymerase [Magnetospirillum sulfuroxidans]MBR9972597.1 polyhydroxyalkanoate depolymerase [Magnetospirillum sulfuroxidans]